MKIIINWVISALTIIVAAYILPGVHVNGFLAALVLAVVLGAINMTLRPILLILTLPISVITLGLFALVINALLIMLAAYIVPGFYVASFWWAFIFGIVLAVVNWIVQMFEIKS